MGRTACTHNHNTTNLVTRLIKLSTATLNLDVLGTDLPQQDNLTDSHSMANHNMVNLSMASLKMEKYLTDSFSPVPIPFLEGNPPQTPGTTHKPGWPP